MPASDIAAWLRELGLERYEPTFRANDIDADVLPELGEADLEKLGVSLGHRKKLLRAIAALAAGDGGPSGPSPAMSPEAAPEIEGERRQVAVMFADLTGYTELSRQLDAEEVHTLLERFFERVDGIVDQFGGSVDKHIGDCVMAVFGAPIAHGNDAERAARAALAIHDAIPGLSAQLGRTLEVHIGLAAGQVVASRSGSAAHREYTVTGDSVNLASRLTDAAPSGAILLSEVVRRMLPPIFACEQAGRLSVKGLAEPVGAFRLIGMGRAAAERPPFVGRRAELAQFQGVLGACREAGTGQAVVVRGEAGIGKTRVVEEFQAVAEDAGFACQVGLVLDFGAGIGQDAIRTLVRSLLGLSVSSAPTAAQAAAERALSDGLVASEQRVYLNDLLDLPQPTALRALYDAMDNATRNRGKRATVTSLVRSFSERQPLLLVIEDVHWADWPTLEHLAALTETVAGCPALLVMTSRIEGDPLDRAWRSSTAGSPLLTIDLGPLRPQEATALAGAYLDATADFAQRCIERAAGNPLFLEQLLRHAEQNSAAGVPGSVQSLVQARMDQLDPRDKQALQAASVFGQRCALEALRHLIDDPDYDCAPLIRRFLIRPVGDDFLFAHALIRDAVYESLLRARRRALHLRAADWYGQRDAVLRAEHLERAEDPEAARAFSEAAQAEAALLRYERALRMAERGLALARTIDERLGLTMLQAEYLREVGRAKDSIAAFREALDLAADDMLKCRAWIGVAAGVRLLGGDTEGMQALDEAEPLARRHQADRELARICYYRGCLLFAAGEVDACVGQHEQARDAAVRAGDPEWEAWTLSGLGDAHYARGRMRLALEHFRRCRTLCHQHGFGRAEVGSTQMIGVTRRYLNEFREAIGDLRAAASTAAKVGNTRTEMVALTVLGEVLIDHGELESAYAALEKALAIADALGNPRFRIYGLYELGRAFWYDEERRGEAEPVLAEALALSRQTGMTFLGPRVLAAMAVVTDSGRERRAALDEGDAIVRAGCLAHVGLWFYRDAIEASLDAADWGGVERYADALEAFTRPEPLPWSDFFIARGRVLVAIGRGRRDENTRLELERLCGEARRLELVMVLPALEQASARL